MVLLLSLIVTGCVAQGCSDAGFCTAGALKGGVLQHNDSTGTASEIGIAVNAGSGEQGVFTLAPQLEYHHKIGRKGKLDVSVPFVIATGGLGTHTGLGDPIVTCSYPLWQHNGYSLKGTAGLRIGTGNADATGTAGALPMPYQTTLGTTDLIAGISLTKKWLSLAAGWQQPVIQYNNNGYYPDKPGMVGDYNKYFPSACLERRGDVLFRATAMHSWKKLELKAGPLFIYHLGKDRVCVSPVSGVGGMTELNGSEGLTLNLTGELTYTLGHSWLSIAGGTPYIVRDVRPDGLTRSWAATVRYTTRIFRE